MLFFIRIYKIIGIGIITTYRTIKAFCGIILFKKKDFFSKEIKIWADNILNIIGIEVIVTGTENINLNEKYIYIGNHTNLIDIPISVKALSHDNIYFMYRKSLQKVPVLGFALKISPCIPIVRESSTGAMSSVEHANKSLSEASVIMFPEGTRNYTGVVGKFKRGAFLLAQMSKKHIVPISIQGVEKISPPKKSWQINSGKIHVHINPPITEIPTDRTILNQLISDTQALISDQRKKNS